LVQPFSLSGATAAFAAAFTMAMKSAATSDAPPINPPSTSGSANRLAALPGFGTRLSFQPVVSNPEPGDGWNGPTGFVHDHVRAAV